MLKKWAILSTCAIATIVVIMALSELKDEEEEKEELQTCIIDPDSRSIPYVCCGIFRIDDHYRPFPASYVI